MNSRHPSPKLLAANWIALVVLHFMILGSAYLNLKYANTPIIAVFVLVQTLLVILYFMELRYSAKLVWFFAAAGFFWLLIQFTLVASDYFTRGWH